MDLYRTRQLVTERLQAGARRPSARPNAEARARRHRSRRDFYYSLDYSADAPHKPATRRGPAHGPRPNPGIPGEAVVAWHSPASRRSNTRRRISNNKSSSSLIRHVCAARGMSLDMLAEIIQQNARNAGGGYVEIGGEQFDRSAPPAA